ncbi:hypothetical protein QTP88_011926 [Uroleucon formosanum]
MLVRVASVGRSFSTLRRMKTWLRCLGWMGETCLTGLCLLHVHREVLLQVFYFLPVHPMVGFQVQLWGLSDGQQLILVEIVFILRKSESFTENLVLISAVSAVSLGKFIEITSTAHYSLLPMGVFIFSFNYILCTNI